MADLILTNQSIIAGQIKTRTDQFLAELNQRKAIWDRITNNKKIAWIKSGKDPILSIAWELFRYLENFFGGIDTNG